MSARALKFLALLSMAVALSGAILIAAWSQLNSYMVRAGPATEETVVVLPRGAGLGQITTALVDAGVIDHPWLFRLAVRVLGRDRDLRAGEYAFPARATPQGVIAMLAKGETVARRLTVAEGLTVAEIFQLLEGTEALVGELPPPPPEGSLLPETYFYALGDSRVELVRRMEDAMRETLDELFVSHHPIVRWRQQPINTLQVEGSMEGNGLGGRPHRHRRGPSVASRSL